MNSTRSYASLHPRLTYYNFILPEPHKYTQASTFIVILHIPDIMFNAHIRPLVGLGGAGDLVKVLPGYFRNWLNPQGFAEYAPRESARKMERDLKAAGLSTTLKVVSPEQKVYMYFFYTFVNRFMLLLFSL